METLSSRQPAAQIFRFDQSGALLSKVMDNAAVGMVLVGIDRRLLYVNAAFCETFGFSRHESQTLALDRILHDDDIECGLQLHRLLSGEADDFRGECRFRHADGGAIWMLTAASVLRSDRTGRPLYVILQLTSIDRQKRAEEALAYTEHRWSSALEAAGQGVWDFDARSDEVYYSPTWRRMRGFGLDDRIDSSQSSWLERVHPDDRERVRTTVGMQEKGRDGYDILEYRERHRDGHYIWILSRGRPVEWDGQGNPVRTIGTDTDITRLKVAEASLAEEKEKLRVTLESIGDGVIATDAAACITFMNPIAEEMTGWDEAVALGRPVAEVFAIKDQAGKSAGSPVGSCIESGEVVYLDAESVLVGRNGTHRDVRSSAAPVRTPERRIIGAVLVFQDITQSRTLQKELAHSASHDALTGLPNRAAYESALAAAVESARVERRKHALCFIDLDRFKSVNDGAGHAAGDALLRQVADTIRISCRSNDFAARIGGDEFAVLLTDCTQANAKLVAQKIVDLISRIDFAWNGHAYTIGASIGISEISATGWSSLGAAGEADAACYAAKAAGRGRIMRFAELPASRGRPERPQ